MRVTRFRDVRISEGWPLWFRALRVIAFSSPWNLSTWADAVVPVC